MQSMKMHQLQRTIEQLKQEQKLQLANSHRLLHSHSYDHSHGHIHGQGRHSQTPSRDGDSRNISRLRRRQMLQRHVSKRRNVDRSKELQANLYKYLDQQQPRRKPALAHAPSPPQPPSPSVPAPPPRDRDAIQRLPGELLDIQRRRRETERRRRLLHAIGLLNRLPLWGRRGEADRVENQRKEENRIGAANTMSASNASTAAPQSQSSDMAEELQQLEDSLRHLSLACQQRPTLRGSAVGVELARELEGTRRIVASLLEHSGCVGGGKGDGCSGGGSCGEDRQQQKTSKNKTRDPVFWRCPIHTELTQRSGQRSKRCPPEHRRGVSEVDDSVGKVVSRANSALLGDGTFHVSSLGKETCWGKMTVPVSQHVVTNAADQLGRKHIRRCRMRQRRESTAAEIEEFADGVAEKWETIEATRVDRSINAACRRLRRAIRSMRGGRRRRRRSSGTGGGIRGESQPPGGCPAGFLAHLPRNRVRVH